MIPQVGFEAATLGRAPYTTRPVVKRECSRSSYLIKPSRSPASSDRQKRLNVGATSSETDRGRRAWPS
uniref:Uncharacterized protein n=1 Tax=Steinernema glaseri TaxID=37863 RepID=A0A1I7YN85_9BILA